MAAAAGRRQVNAATAVEEAMWLASVCVAWRLGENGLEVGTAVVANKACACVAAPDWLAVILVKDGGAFVDMPLRCSVFLESCSCIAIFRES